MFSARSTPWHHRSAIAVSLGLSVLGLGGCGQPKQAEDPHVIESAGTIPPDSSAPVLESVDTPLTSLERASVARTVDAGFSAFLQRVEVEDSLKDGRFEGFRIVRFTVPEDWRGVGLLVGDVVTSVNDQPIERPEQAYAVFVSLRSAKVLEVSYLRAGKPMRLSLPIVGEAPPPKAPAAAVAPASDPPAAKPAEKSP
jgi:hypothetical protein